ncbi:DUF4303 domain-containing protein [Gordonia hydrophobica]|uniref:DUF4303 domain-containing protein n=1 Tax=Gordonia hydrophobica TaxID=40516 RepID=A0ABZ2U1S2_9ACTN|nr:DUF4303 domain-containing protein [Gordonia hydrophobica]MBM7366714.1 hypothetical protein [Gordonia hydrophobica]
MTSPAFDWDALTAALVDDIRSAVHAFHDEYDDEIYGIALYAFYADGESIAWPMVGVSGSTSDVAEEDDLRWSPYDWDFACDPSDAGDAWSTRLSGFAKRDRARHWDEVEDRFYAAVIAACATARAELTANSLIPDSALVVAADEGEELIARCVSAAELAEHFPHLHAEAAEKERIATLPVAERITALLDAIEHDDRPLNWESAPPLLYEVARTDPDPVLDALVQRLLSPGERRYRWADAISTIGIARPDVIAALTTVVDDEAGPDNVRGWAGSALCRLGRTDVVADRYDLLPDGWLHVFGTPYSDPRTGHRADFAPLEAVLDDHPDLDAELEMRINHRVAEIDVDPYFAALESTWPSIRSHAAWSLVHTSLDDADRARFAAALDSFVDDPALAEHVDVLRDVFDRSA